MAKFELTAENVKKVLSKRIAVLNEGSYITEGRLSEKSFSDSNWNEGEPYRIFNTNLMTQYQFEKAKEYFKNGKYQEAINQGLSVRVSEKMANKIQSCFEIGVKVISVDNKVGDSIFVIDSKESNIKPIMIEKISFGFDISELDSFNDIEVTTPKKELVEA